MKSQIAIHNTAEVCRIDIEGTIGVPEEWQFDDPRERVATYEKFRDTVRRIARIEAAEVVVSIRSTGGDVNDALMIHDALRESGARITTRCYGYTASAATLIAQAASEGCREISSNALYLIHNSVCATEGNAEELAGRLDLLRATDERIAAVYAARSGREAASFEALMRENNGCGRWLSPAETVAAGLADRIIDAAPECDSLAGNLVRGWERLVGRLGRRSRRSMPGNLHGTNPSGPDTEPGRSLPETRMPRDRNILHFEEEERTQRRRALTAAQEALQHVAPTRTRPCDDPSCDDPGLSPNRRAYDEDARRMRG